MGLRPLLLSSTTYVLLGLVIAALALKRRWPARPLCHDLRRILSHPGVLAFIVLGASVNLSLRAISGYINPRDYIQDVIAARQFWNHDSLYPPAFPDRAVAELAASMPGQELLKKLPFIQGEFARLSEPPVSLNAHPPLLGMLFSVPVWLLGLRGSFAFFFLLFLALLCASIRMFMHTLFPGATRSDLTYVFGLALGWHAAGDALRAVQPSIPLLALMVAAWLLLQKGREYLAGSAIGLATSLHTFPGLLIVYFAVRYRRAAFSSLATIAAVGMAVALTTVPGTFSEWLRSADYISRVFLPTRENISMAGVLVGFSNLMLWGWNPKAVAVAIIIFVAGCAVMVLQPWKRMEPESDRFHLEYSMFLVAMLFCSPVSWSRYLPILLLPLAVLVRVWPRDFPRWGLAILLAGGVFLTIPDQAVGIFYTWLAERIGGAAAWIVTSVQTFLLVALYLWLLHTLGANRVENTGIRSRARL